MRSAHYLIAKPDGSTFVSEVRLEHNLPFAKEEGIKWMQEKHDTKDVRYVSQKHVAELQRIQA